MARFAGVSLKIIIHSLFIMKNPNLSGENGERREMIERMRAESRALALSNETVRAIARARILDSIVPVLLQELLEGVYDPAALPKACGERSLSLDAPPEPEIRLRDDQPLWGLLKEIFSSPSSVILTEVAVALELPTIIEEDHPLIEPEYDLENATYTFSDGAMVSFDHGEFESAKASSWDELLAITKQHEFATTHRLGSKFRRRS
jgi:hypothetical protein